MKRYFSSGGGVQSTACLVLSAQRKIDYPVHIFANVGDNAESQKTIEYVQSVLKPFAEKHGIEWIEVCRKDKSGTKVDLYNHLLTSERSIAIPVRMSKSGAPGNRTCTVDWKIKPVAKYLKAQIPAEIKKEIQKESRNTLGKAAKFLKKKILFREKFPIILGKGISTDECHRANSNSGFEFYEVEYPLIDLGLSRQDCLDIVAAVDLPPPPKSSCWFCPYTKFSQFQKLSNTEPEIFQKACDLEVKLSHRAVSLGRGKTFFTDRGVKRNAYLQDLIEPGQQELNFEQEDLSFCESGFCVT